MKKEQDFKIAAPADHDVSKDQSENKIENSSADSSFNSHKEPVPAMNSQITKNSPKAGKVIPLDPEKVNSDKSGKARKRLMAILMFVLIGILISVLANSFGLTLWGEPNKANAAFDSAKEGDIETLEIQWDRPEKISDDVRDVTGKVNSSAENGKIVVQGIICSDHSSLAMISGQIVKEGDLIMGCRILEVKRNAVVFQKDGKTWSQTVE